MKELDCEFTIRLQRLRTGHVAPYADNDIQQCIEQSNRFPHAPILSPLADARGKVVSEDPIPELISMPKGSLVLDCGAFIGANSTEFISHGWKVMSFEPFPDAYYCLCLNSPCSINIMAAVGNGERVLLDWDCPGTNHGMRSVKLNQEGVPTTRIDDLPVDNVRFIKIDCEGHERFVLEGARQTILRDRPYLFVEIFPELLQKRGVTVKDMEAVIRSLGYTKQEFGTMPRVDWFCYPSKQKTME